MLAECQPARRRKKKIKIKKFGHHRNKKLGKESIDRKKGDIGIDGTATKH